MNSTLENIALVSMKAGHQCKSENKHNIFMQKKSDDICIEGFDLCAKPFCVIPQLAE